MKSRITRILEIMEDFNVKNDECTSCPFYEPGYCSGDFGKPCIVEDLTNIVRICVDKDVLRDED